MHWTVSDPAVRFRLALALALTFAGAIGLVLPLVVTGVSSASALGIAALAVAVAGMVRLGSRRELALALVPVRAHLSSDEPHVLHGRGTDPV